MFFRVFWARRYRARECIARTNEICDRFGIDTISAGNVLAFAMGCYERGIIAQKDLGGYALSFGDYEPILATLRKIAYREGFGSILAEGVSKHQKL